MIETIKGMLESEFLASLCTLNACIERCPEASWKAPVASYKFCQVVFHTLFYADHYLGPDEASFLKQPFHLENKDFFRDYEELEDRKPQNLYEKPDIRRYVQFCRDKASTVIAAETAESLCSRCGFERRNFSRAELYVYNTRHVQHHAAQLILRLRLNTDVDVPWVRAGWMQI